MTHEKATLYIDEKQVGDDVRAHLGSHVEIKPYGAIFNELSELAKLSAAEDEQVCVTARQSTKIPR